MKTLSLLIIFLTIFLLPLAVHSGCDCSTDKSLTDKPRARNLHIVAIFAILGAGAVGCTIPSLGKRFPILSPEKDFFFLIKAFAAGVILATGFIHILPDGYDRLTSACLPESPWQNFPFASFIAMVTAIMTLMIDTLASGYFQRKHFNKHAAMVTNLEAGETTDHDAQSHVHMHTHATHNHDAHESHVHMHTHATHGHAHGWADGQGEIEGSLQILRNRITAEIFELGIIVHSVIIGLSLGASQTPSVIKPLIAALTFHQFFEGMGLGACIVQARFNIKPVVIMSLFFSLTTPIGIIIGIGISSSYDENSHKALIVEGVLDSASAGILIYMALVDLLAQDFMNPKIQNNGILQILVNVFLLLGAGLMSVIAKWN
ncbi:hypothetical protein LUZ60_010999 [Juncus effusus]|nr:hypothetical protein LUZ60_010999 [Juncus effusus]